jgi:uncharacterized sulfatase
MTGDAIPSELPTVAERFRQSGYDTACISPNSHLSSATGLDRGFDEFEWLTTSNLLDGVGPRTLLRYLLGLRRHGAGFTASMRRHRSEYLAFSLATDWLRSFVGESEPFFLFVHTLGTHVPYHPPLPYQDAFTDDIEMDADEAVEFAFERSDDHYRETAAGCDYSPAEAEALRAAYDGLLAYVDEQVGEFFESVQRLAPDDLAFVVTADHGDLLGERGVLGHQLALHDGLLNVPMVTHGVDAALGRGDEVVQHLDVMQTLLGQAGARTEQFQGVDLRAESREYALAQRGSETFDTAVSEIRQHNPEFDASRFDSSMVHCFRGQRFKYLRSDERERLYELSDEETDISERRPDVLERYSSSLDEDLAAIGRELRTADRREMTDAMRRRLEDLGYVVD